MIRKGKCTNKAGCLLAYRGEEIMISTGELNCPECGSPLIPSGDSKKAGARIFLVAGGLIGLVLIAALVAGVVMQFKRLQRTGPGPSPTPSVTSFPSPGQSPVRIERAQPVHTPDQAAQTPEGNIPVRRAIPANPSATQPPLENVGLPVATRNPNLDLGNEENRTVKREVLKRIDLMPTISFENKDKLYMSVERARKMGKLLTVPFSSGRSTLGNPDVEALKREIHTPEMQKLMEDPTAVFVILGYADTKGDPAKNQKISEERAQNVMTTLRERCGVANVMHAVGMGGSTLLDAQGTEKNRAAEIWAVLP